MRFMDKVRASFQAARAAHSDRLDLLNRGDADSRLLFLAERSFAKGRAWAQGVYESGDGRCLVGALRAMRTAHGISGDRSDELLRVAIAERQGVATRSIEDFNDSRRSYADVAAVLRRARQLAHHSAAVQHKEQTALPPPAPPLLLEHTPAVMLPTHAKVTVRKS